MNHARTVEVLRGVADFYASQRQLGHTTTAKEGCAKDPEARLIVSSKAMGDAAGVPYITLASLPERLDGLKRPIAWDNSALLSIFGDAAAAVEAAQRAARTARDQNEATQAQADSMAMRIRDLTISREEAQAEARKLRGQIETSYGLGATVMKECANAYQSAAHAAVQDCRKTDPEQTLTDFLLMQHRFLKILINAVCDCATEGRLPAGEYADPETMQIHAANVAEIMALVTPERVVFMPFTPRLEPSDFEASTITGDDFPEAAPSVDIDPV